MRALNLALCGVAMLAGLCLHVPAHAVTFSIEIERTSADPGAQTFSGSGLVRFDSPAASPAEIDFFSLTVETIGGTFVGPDLVEVPRTFVFGLADIVAVTDLVAGPTLGGVIELGSKASQDGAVVLGEPTVLDFTGGLASGFCFDAVGGEQCVFGGGSSTAVEAELTSAIIPLPGALPLLLAALGGLALVSRRRAALPFAGA